MELREITRATGVNEMQGYNYEAAKAIFAAMCDYTSADFDTLGVTPDDFDLVASNKPWHATNRRQVVATIDAIMFATTDAMGLDRITLPSEYVAGAIQMSVAPINQRTAAIWLAAAGMAGARAVDLSSKDLGGGDFDPATATQLFALVVLLSDPSISSEPRQKYLTKMLKQVNTAQTAKKGANVA